MNPSSKKPVRTKKNGTKGTQSRRRENTSKLLVLALATRMRKRGPKRPKPPRPPAEPVARIKGNAVPGGSGELYCALIGDLADKAIDDMEQAIMNEDDAALQKAFDDFDDALDTGHDHGCYFTYEW